jgi:hypothetical protein
LAASTAYGAYDRYFNQEQSGWQALLGGAADATGISGIYTGITGRDLVTQHHLSLTPAQQRQILTEGSIQAVGSALVLYGGLRSFLRGRVPVAPTTGAAANPAQRRVLYHYTDEAGVRGITESGELRPSLRANNPRDVRYGEGQYMSDFAPGTRTPAQLSREFLGQPFQGRRFTHYVEIDVTGLNVVQGRNGVFVVPGNQPLDLTGRIVGSGPVPPVGR